MNINPNVLIVFVKEPRPGGVKTRLTPALELGASPRGTIALLAVAKAYAWLSGRDWARFTSRAQAAAVAGEARNP